jgi:hypothetical protein
VTRKAPGRGRYRRRGERGFILFGWSIAFLLALMGKLRMLEHDWLERPPEADPRPGRLQ